MILVYRHKKGLYYSILAFMCHRDSRPAKFPQKRRAFTHALEFH